MHRIVRRDNRKGHRRPGPHPDRQPSPLPGQAETAPHVHNSQPHVPSQRRGLNSPPLDPTQATDPIPVRDQIRERVRSTGLILGNPEIRRLARNQGNPEQDHPQTGLHRIARYKAVRRIPGRHSGDVHHIHGPPIPSDPRTAIACAATTPPACAPSTEPAALSSQ
jgi:hypothetical protein